MDGKNRTTLDWTFPASNAALFYVNPALEL